MKPKSIKLTAAREVALLKIAKRTKSFSVHTAAPGPSWRTLINRIADGELKVVQTPEVRPAPESKPESKQESIRNVPQSPAESLVEKPKFRANA